MLRIAVPDPGMVLDDDEVAGEERVLEPEKRRRSRYARRPASRRAAPSTRNCSSNTSFGSVVSRPSVSISSRVRSVATMSTSSKTGLPPTWSACQWLHTTAASGAIRSAAVRNSSAASRSIVVSNDDRRVARADDARVGDSAAVRRGDRSPCVVRDLLEAEVVHAAEPTPVRRRGRAPRAATPRRRRAQPGLLPPPRPPGSRRRSRRRVRRPPRHGRASRSRSPRTAAGSSPRGCGTTSGARLGESSARVPVVPVTVTR